MKSSTREQQHVYSKIAETARPRQLNRVTSSIRPARETPTITTLAGGIAQNFNALLTVIIGYTEIAIADIPQGSTTWDHLQQVLTAGQRAKDLVLQLLAYSGQINPWRQHLNISSFVREKLTQIRMSRPSAIEMRQNIATDAGMVLADCSQIHQVLLHLYMNAEYAMRETGGVLEIGLQAVAVDTHFATQYTELDPGPYICLTVRDTGTGIAPEVLEHIFEPFFTTKEVGEGIGIGLAVVYGVVTAHGGAITAESTPGFGTTVTIYLPRIGDIHDGEASA